MERDRPNRDRGERESERRGPRDDMRNHKPRYEQDRSRSPPRRDRRDDRRRDRSPPSGPAPRGTGPPPRSDRDRDRDRDYPRGGRESGPPRAGRPDDRRRPRDTPDGNRSNVVKAAAQGAPNGKPKLQEDTKMEPIDADEDSEAEMRRIMGFADFRTTKNTKVPGNDKNYAVHKVKKAEYRQYMNRTGGFNRPLSPSRM